MCKFFPIIMIVLNLCASAVFFIKGKQVFAWYWISAASITASTLFME